MSWSIKATSTAKEARTAVPSMMDESTCEATELGIKASLKHLILTALGTYNEDDEVVVEASGTSCRDGERYDLRNEFTAKVYRAVPPPVETPVGEPVVTQ